jgi:hypothetical protein
MATPSESGTAIKRAISEDSSVPKTRGNAPNSSATGSQVLEVTKSNPYRLMARLAPVQSS